MSRMPSSNCNYIHHLKTKGYIKPAKVRLLDNIHLKPLHRGQMMFKECNYRLIHLNKCCTYNIDLNNVQFMCT